MPRDVHQTLRRLLAGRTPDAKSLVVTVFGDAVVPHGSLVWIGSLIRWLAPFGINERAVRTALYRLCREGWFTNRSIGRRSDYGLTPLGRHNFADAERRIYAAEPPPWTGEWSLVLLGQQDVPGEKRDRARRSLRWHGFGELAPSVLLHPAGGMDEVRLVLSDLGLERKAIVLRARSESLLPAEGQALRNLAAAAWDLGDLTTAYRDYCHRFRPLSEDLASAALPVPEVCFSIRVLAIHEYRRVLLRDPELPLELLPEDWVGTEARRLCRAIYRRVHARAAEHVRATGRTSEGPLPPPAAFSSRRFTARHRAGGDQSPRKRGSRFSRNARTPS
ncbi:MAG: phenylacetic acid degradation operon negative regulatory protein [Candidatus Binatota bacterium]|nr:phenylacetic acid degradation operon negative regulatory protein [Candidatus Binatota bacterium]